MAKGKRAKIIKNKVQRKQGYMYYVTGAGVVMETKMKHGKKKSGRKA